MAISCRMETSFFGRGRKPCAIRFPLDPFSDSGDEGEREQQHGFRTTMTHHFVAPSVVVGADDDDDDDDVAADFLRRDRFLLF
jgi:hypothetical protein